MKANEVKARPRNKKGFIIKSVILCVIIVALTIVGIIFRRDIYRFLKNLFGGKITKEDAKAFMRSFGWRGGVVISVCSMLQVVLTFLPAEPIQVVSGMGYGLFAGVGICMIGVFLGNNIMFLLSRTLGAKLTNYFKDKIKIDLSSGAATGKIAIAVLITYILPAIPYGLICFMTASTDMKYYKYILLTTFGSLPSVYIGAALGVIAIEKGLILSLITLVIIIAFLIVVFCLREKVFAAINRLLVRSSQPYTTAHTVRKPNKFIYRLSEIFVGGIVKHKVKLKIRKTFKRLPHPCIVVCSHPSFFDWAYAALALKPEYGNFIISRYYYFHRKLAWLVKQVGTMPKSMFTVDVESARNSYRVIKGGGVLCLMPEARLSTCGKMDSISDMSAQMFIRLGVPVYSVKIEGAYLAKPKWGSGFRKGAQVDVSADLLFTAEDLKNHSAKELNERMTAALYYNDFEWLEQNPDVKYKSKKLAEGLQNILMRCPDCGREFTLNTQGNKIYCDCGFAAELDERYGFIRTAGLDMPLYKNFQDWYYSDYAALEREIRSDPDYELTDKVKLSFPDPTGKKFHTEVGEGVCTLNREGFTFEGTVNGEPHTLKVPQRDMYLLLFGSGEEFEIYHGKNYYYFVPNELRSCVKWYAASGILHGLYEEQNAADGE